MICLLNKTVNKSISSIINKVNKDILVIICLFILYSSKTNVILIHFLFLLDALNSNLKRIKEALIAKFKRISKALNSNSSELTTL